MKIIFTGGGTAGHIFPIISIVREIKKAKPSGDFEFFYIGPNDNFSKELLEQEGIKIKRILAGKIRRYFSFYNLIDIFKVPLGFFQAFYHIFVISPDIIFSKGGYGSVPVVLAGWILFVPIFVHESDSVPGLANKIEAKLALEIFTAFPIEENKYFPIGKVLSVGNPIRQKILNPPPKNPKEVFNLAGGKPLILILGGSQGAQRINDEILANLSGFLQSFEIIHQTGFKNFEEVKKEAAVVVDKELMKYYHPVSFLNEEEFSIALWSADLIISRAGAGAIFEITAVGKPVILVPLEKSAQNHQIKNAYILSELGAAIVIESSNFKSHFILERIKQLLNQPDKLAEIAERARAFSKPEAGRIIAEYIIAYLENKING